MPAPDRHLVKAIVTSYHVQTLPHNAQALFRPVSMCVPDLSLICEIMLMAEGFQQSKARPNFALSTGSRQRRGAC